MPAKLGLRLAILAPIALIGAGLILACAGDRYAELRQTLLVPGDYPSAHAKLVRAYRSRDAGGLSEAERLALSAVRLEPLNQAAVAMLGEISLQRGDLAAAASQYLVSGQLGWRHAGTQEYWFDQALAAQAYQVAAERLEALLRLPASNASAQRRATTLEASAAGREALAKRLEASPSLAGSLRFPTASEEQIQNRLRLLSTLAQKGVPLDAKAAGEFARQLFNSGRPRAARQLWVQLAVPPQDRDALILNGAFDWGGALAFGEENATPFMWRLSESQGIAVELEQAPHPLTGRALRVRSETGSSAGIFRQLLALPAGTYMLAWRQTGGDLQVLPGLACIGPNTAGSLALEPAKNGSYVFKVPSTSACEAQSLLFSTGSGGAAGAEIWIDDVKIGRAG